VAGIDAHTVHALDAADGKPLWEFTAGGRVDSPPTISYVGRISNPSKDGLETRPTAMCLFGSRDGRVYCLRTSDGALAWRFDAAPRRRLLTAFGQLESPWPVPGSVLVKDGKCHFAAGRSSYLDGGIHLWTLGATTGEVERQKKICHTDPKTGKMAATPDGHKMTGLLNDIPVTDGANVFIRQMQLASSDGAAKKHLYTTAGFLDSSWFNRTFWKYGPVQTSGMMVLGDDLVYGVEAYHSRGRDTGFIPGSNAYRLRCYSLKPGASKTAGGKKPPPKRRGGAKPVWEQRTGMRVTAMVRAGDIVFAAGAPDVIDPKDPHGAWEGRKGGVLAAYDAADGKKLARYKLPSPPVWDGMAAANGRLYISLTGGHVQCWAPR